MLIQKEAYHKIKRELDAAKVDLVAVSKTKPNEDNSWGGWRKVITRNQ